MSISNAPFVMYARFYRHNATDIDKHKKHIEYIATRPGVDKGASIQDLEPEISPADVYSEYIAARPGSQGLFSYREISSYKDIQNELAEHSSFSWRFVLSLRADDAVNMGYDNREKWEGLIRSQINTASEKMGIERSNLRWVAAFHVHPQQVNCHAHIVIWEKALQRTTGKLSAKEMKDIKKTFSDEIFREKRLMQMQEKAAMRDYIREHAKGSVTRAKELIREIRQAGKEGELYLRAWMGANSETLPPSLIEEKELAEKLHLLSQAMPGKGRAALQFMPGETKVQAREVADWILQQPHFRQQVTKHQNAAEQLAKTYTRKEDQLKQAREKAYSDIRDRVANIAIRASAALNKESRQVKWNQRTKNITAARTARTCWRSAWQSVERERLQTEAQAEVQKRQMAAKEQAKKLKEKYRGKDYRDKENAPERR